MTDSLIPMNETPPLESLQGFIDKHYPNIFFMDTETSGFSGEVIEYSILDLTGKSGLRMRCKPVIPTIDKGATECHGITLNDLRGEGYFIEGIEKMLKSLNDGTGGIVMYNSDFDIRMIQNSLTFTEKNFYKIKNKISDSNSPYRNLEFFVSGVKKVLNMESLCLMKSVSGYNKSIGNGGKWLKLSKAAEQFGVHVDDAMLHGSAYDTGLTREIFISLAHKISGDPFRELLLN